VVDRRCQQKIRHFCSYFGLWNNNPSNTYHEAQLQPATTKPTPKATTHSLALSAGSGHEGKQNQISTAEGAGETLWTKSAAKNLREKAQFRSTL
jgi:hypothetical protein